MNKLTSVALAALMVLVVFAADTASATDTVEINAIGNNYEYDGWSNEQYPLIDLFGEEYVPLFISNGNVWNCRVNKLAKLVLDSDMNYTLQTGDKIELGKGYTLEAKQFDIDGKKVWLEFSKDGQYVDDQIINVYGSAAEKTWTVAIDNIQNENNVVVMKVHVNQIIPDVSGSIAQIDGIWLIDYANTMTLKIDDKFGAFKLTEINGEKLVFEFVDDQPALNEIRIPTNESLKGYPSIYENRIVWADLRNGQDIYMYDLSTSKETQISSNESWNDVPAIYGDRIVWQSNSIGNWSNGDIFLYDLSTSQKTRITNDGSNQQDPAIYQDRIVWADWRNDKGNGSNGDIYLYDLSTSKEIQITANESYQGTPAIYKDRVVWSDMRNGNSDIYMYNITTSKETRITNNEADQNSPDIYGDIIVWKDWRNGDENSDIYMYDLFTSKETQITINESNQYSPAIYGDRIVWEDERNGILDEFGSIGNYDIYMYNISTSTETQITTNTADQVEPFIYGNRIFWIDKRSGYSGTHRNSDIYMFTISGEENEINTPTSDFSTNVTEGYAPLSMQFTDLSENATGRNWDFENDGKVDSTDKNPVHEYTVPGTYTVKLIAFNANGMASKLGTITVLQQVLPIANFSSNVTEGYAPLSVQFTDSSVLNELQSSIPPTQQVITEADNGTSINLKNGENFTFKLRENPGFTGYSWQLNLSEGLSILSDEYENQNPPDMYDGPLTRLVVIKAVDQGIQHVNGIYKRSWENTTGTEANFTLNAIISPNTTSRVWDFGDGTNSAQQNPMHTYAVSGNYTVSLTVTNAAGSNKTTKSDYIKVTADIQKPVADFSSNVTEGNAPLSVQFKDNSVLNELQSSMPPTQQVITEADNGTSINLKNGENFTLKLRENPTTGYSWELNLSEGLSIISDDFTQDPAPEGMSGVGGTHSWIIKALSEGTQQVNGIYKRPWENTTGNEDSFTLNAIISSNTTSRVWDFGDGTNSTQQNPMHTYSSAGNYTVSLTATNAAGNNTATRSDYIKVTADIQKPVASFTANVTSGKVPLVVKFTDTSTGSPTSWKWNFGDGTSSTAKNPTHRYIRGGKYTVSLKARNAAGSNTVVTRSGYINAVSSRDSVTAFFASLSSKKAPLKVQFTENFAGLHRARN